MDAQKNKIYRHYKGDLYIVEDFAIHSDTDELMIIYRALYGNCQLFTKPVSAFEEKLSPEAQIKYGQEYRFELIDIKSKNPDH